MVATSEVSVSLTIDNTALERHLRELSEFAEVEMEPDQAIVCLVGENSLHSGSGARVFNALDGINIRMISQGASLLNLSFVVAESRSAPGRGSAARNSSPSSTRGPRCSNECLIAIVGYGKMGRMIERLAPEYGIRGRGA
jgi:hypothetical protein